MISVAIVGATGRMGRLTKELVDQDSTLKLHAALDSSSDISTLQGADVVIEFTNPTVSETIADYAIKNSMKLVIGSSGWSEVKLDSLRKKLEQASDAAVVVIPNFSIGSMLALQFAKQAAKHFLQAEIIEAHHAGKLDSPSGTAIRTAEQIAHSRGTSHLVPGSESSARGQIVQGVPIHSIRLSGVSARQETIFAAESEQLTISHDVSSHRAYSLGILKTIEFAKNAKGLIVGLDQVIG
jgi:4-hydroxy-tetrahydrodipicolinate reductase